MLRPYWLLVSKYRHGDSLDPGLAVAMFLFTPPAAVCRQLSVFLVLGGRTIFINST